MTCHDRLITGRDGHGQGMLGVATAQSCEISPEIAMFMFEGFQGFALQPNKEGVSCWNSESKNGTKVQSVNSAEISSAKCWRFDDSKLTSCCHLVEAVLLLEWIEWSRRVVRHRDHRDHRDRVTVLHHKIGIEWERNANWLFHLQALSGIGIIWYQWFQMIPSYQSYPMKRGMMWHAINGCRQAGWWISETTSDYDRTDITSRTSSSWESTHCRRKRKKRVQLYSASWHTHGTLMEPWNTHALIAILRGLGGNHFGCCWSHNKRNGSQSL